MKKYLFLLTVMLMTNSYSICGIKEDSIKVVEIYKYVVSFRYYIEISDVDEMLKSKFGNCVAHADLFKRMCDSAGIKCISVIGWVKGEVDRHKWNHVTFDGDTWYPIDTTFDSEYNTMDFCMPTWSEFLKTHWYRKNGNL